MPRSSTPLAVGLALALPTAASAATLTVNSTADTDDGVCDSDCTLREALTVATANDTINFSFSGTSAPRTITLSSALPDISVADLLVDGFDCTGCGTVSANTLDPDQGLDSSLGIVIDGPSSGSDPTLSIEAVDATIQGLVFSNSNDKAIRVHSSGATITGCYIGTDITGTVAAGPGDDGIHIDSEDGAVIGPFNIISGATQDGIVATGDADSITIVGNLIGTDVTGLASLPNGREGIRINGTSEMQDLLIGGASASQRNVVSGNTGHGIFLRADIDGDKGSGSFVRGNTIGVSADGLSDLGNLGDGIRVEGISGSKSDHITIDDNLIGGNSGSGIWLQATEAHVITGNSIGTNSVGIDLGNDLDGITIVSQSHHDTKQMDIGDLTYTTPADQNEIAFNAVDGILLNKLAGASKNCKENTIGANSIHDNGGLGVDIENGNSGSGPASPGENVNCNGGAGNNNAFGNRGIGKPAITEADLTGGVLTITGTSCSGAIVDVYSVDDPAETNGQPETFVGTVTATGTAWTMTPTPGSILVGDELTALQRDSDGETSEAADNVVVTTCDADGDGFNDINLAGCPSPVDCDDTDATVYPGAPELCDGLDNDCHSGVPTNELDGDGDTFIACAECDDTDIAVNPAATEVCNIVDDDCDTFVDEGFDTDSDTFTTCGADGVAGNADDDCDDTAAAVNPGATEVCNIVDDDCDTFVDEGFDTDSDTFTTCGADGIAGNADDDCDDTIATVNPSGTEACNALDDDCDGTVDEGFDADADTYTTCGADGVAGNADDDCDDTAAAVNPGAIEACNGIDDDCDGSIDENLDLDLDGVTNCDGDCDDTDNTVFPNAPELCDGIDNDCDGAVPVDEQDLDGDLGLACDDDCDDNDPTVYTGAIEICDGLDNDCDGGVPGDELDADGDGQSRCAGDCDDTDATVHLGAPEVCSDGIDQDCDGVDADDLDADGDGWSACAGDCDDANPDVNPDAEELCDDGIDNDCDDRLLDSSDDDEDGVSACDGDCDDTDPAVFPGQDDVCNDVDDDCDGAVDEDALDGDGDGYDECEDCDDERDDVFPEGDELCDGLDGDCDGVVPDDELDGDGDGVPPCGGDCADDDATVAPGADEVCGDGVDQDCDEADLPCAGTITLGTPEDPVDACATEASLAGGAGPGALALCLLGGLVVRRRRAVRTAPLALLLLVGCDVPTSTLTVQTWWGAEPADGDVFFAAGGAFDAVGLSSSFDVDGAAWTELALVGAPEGTDCIGYAAYGGRAAAVAAEITTALTDPTTRRGAVDDVVGLACQEMDGAARDAFGGDGSHRALTLLVRGEDGGEGLFLPSPAEPAGAVLSVLPATGFFAARYVEWGGLGAGLVPEGDGAESGYAACVGRLTNVFEARDEGTLEDAPAAAMAAWGLAGRRAEHHDPGLDEVAREEGGASPVDLELGGWTGAAVPGAAVVGTHFVTLGDVPEGVGFARAALGVESTDGLSGCPQLAGSEAFAWPEPRVVTAGAER